MKLQRTPARGLCILASFAMALNVPAQELLDRIGDEWQTLAFPGLPVPYCWRGVHIQELILLALEYGYAVTPIELLPQTTSPQILNPRTRQPYRKVVVLRGETEEANWRVFRRTIMDCSGVLTGALTLLRFNRGHAVAFEKGVIFDPDNDAFMYSTQQCETRNFFANCIWRFDKMEKQNDVHAPGEVSHETHT